eukprot:augustus_masked-scaffold_70-processed-gene-0.106-mRNA-1 protein AED:1.00 eAED:1.00 QI:0/0/0/0/1/1/3/0/556
MILEVEKWDDIIIGNDVLRCRCLDPISTLRNKMQTNKEEVKVIEQSYPLVDWFLEEVATVKRVTAMYKKDVNWFREMEEWKDERVLKLEEAISWPVKLCSEEPVNFDPENEEEDFDNDGKIDVEANLGVSREEDKKRIAAKLLTMMSSLDPKVFNNSEVWRTRFTSLFVKYSGSFGDGEFPTVLSSLPSIECNIMEGKSVGVLNQRPLGYKQEEFLDRRLKQMLKAGIIRVNNNPTTAMAVLVVPEKGPKKFRLVVDFHPLNRITQKVSNSLPKIEVQLLRARKMKFFGSFDLFSGFDYLPCTMETGRLFTFTTPSGVAYSFKGAPQGWSNTPSLFSMRQIYDVLLKAEIWPRNCMQWIDDTVIMATSQEELFKILERYLKRIAELNLRLNVDKCHLPCYILGVMDELFVLKIHQLDNANLREVRREKGKIVLSRHLIPYAIVHAHVVFNHGAEKREAEFIRKHYSIEKGLKGLFLQTLKRFRKQCLHYQRRSLIIKRPLNITEFGREARQVLFSDFLYINRSGWILTVIDSLTRTILLYFCQKVEVKEVVKALWK